MTLAVPRESRLSDRAPLLCLLAFAVLASVLVVIKHYPSAFDELEHVSYAAFLQETGRLTPLFEVQQTLVIEDMTRWNDRANYLGHPSPFYLFESLFLDRTLPPARAIVLPRAASAALVLLGVAASLAAARRQFGGDRVATWVFCVGVALCPKLLAVAGQVTNDSLAVLGGGLAYWGVVRAGRVGRAVVGLGLMLALWSKPNAGLAVGAWLGIVAMLRADRVGLLSAMGVGFALGTVPYWSIIARYGALVPVTVEQFGHVRQLDGFGSYLPAFLVSVGSSWCFATKDAWPPTIGGATVAALFWLMMGCVVAGGVGAWRRRGEWGGGEAIAVAAPVAFALVLPIHFWFSATKLGFSLPAASFRYYLPLWPALMHALAYRITLSSRRLRIGIVALFLALLAIGWVSP